MITFADHPNLAVRFTNQPPLLAGGLAGLTATGNTTLYDSLIYALYYFGGIKGKRAIILLSDGKDEGSHYSFDDALDYARRSGVAIYTVGISLSSQDHGRPRSSSAASPTRPAAASSSSSGPRRSTASTTPSRRSCARSTSSPTSPPRKGATPTSSAPSR